MRIDKRLLLYFIWQSHAGNGKYVSSIYPQWFYDTIAPFFNRTNLVLNQNMK